jgi:large subunit ribosomal protein L6
MVDKNKGFEEKFAFPKGVNASVLNGIVTLKGPKGETSKSFLHPKVDVKVENNEITFSTEKDKQVEKKLIQTYKAHIKNLSKGVVEGHIYKLKICSGHFPMNVSIKNNIIEIKNFIGEAVPRTLELTQGVDVKLEGDKITVTGVNKEKTSQMAASIEKLTRRNGFDRRVFQDGIYITEKDGKKL